MRIPKPQRLPASLHGGHADACCRPAGSLLLARQHKHPQYGYQRILEHRVVIHDDGDPANVRQVPARAAGRGSQATRGVRTAAGGCHATRQLLVTPWFPPRRLAAGLALAGQRPTHPTTTPMMWPGLSHSWPLGYRLRSSPQLLSPCTGRCGRCGIGQTPAHRSVGLTCSPPAPRQQMSNEPHLSKHSITTPLLA